jgi:hypothetical protein
MRFTRHSSQEECEQSSKLLPLSIFTRKTKETTDEWRRQRAALREEENKHGTTPMPPCGAA